jgi:hypothetical protein
MTTRPDPTSLFEGLDGRALEQREELISWLLDQGFDLGTDRRGGQPHVSPG